jgi:hypothetical protein
VKELLVPYIEVYEKLLADSDFNMDENNCDNSDGESEVIRDNSFSENNLVSRKRLPQTMCLLKSEVMFQSHVMTLLLFCKCKL